MALRLLWFKALMHEASLKIVKAAKFKSKHQCLQAFWRRK